MGWSRVSERKQWVMRSVRQWRPGLVGPRAMVRTMELLEGSEQRQGMM